MSSEKSSDDGSPVAGDMAVIGEGTPNRMPVSIQVLQNIYHELTGKAEEVSKSYEDALHVAFNDFKQLHLRIRQTCEQYNICSANCSVTVFYINDTKDTYSSFERFEAFNAGSSSSVESVLLNYNFLIILPKIAQPQSYTISVRIASPVAIQRKMNENMFEVPKVFKLMGGPKTAVVNIKYIDYAVARTLLNTIDEWFSALPRSKSGAIWMFIRKHTDWLPLITRYLTGLVVGSTAVVIAPHFLRPTSTPLELAQFLLNALLCIFAAYKLAQHLGNAAEDSIDNWVDLSYVSLTDGDKREIELAKERNRGALVWGGLKLLGGLLVSVLAKFIANALVTTP